MLGLTGIMDHAMTAWGLQEPERPKRLRDEECRNDPVASQHHQLTLKLQGHYNYYGITGNGRSLTAFFEQVKNAWRTWLSKRSQKSYLNWQQFSSLLSRYRLPPPVVIHSIYRSPSTRVISAKR